MRNFKFLATTVVALMLACVLAVASFAAITPFTDVDDEKNKPLSEAVSLLSGLGVAKGTSETTFGTMEHVTRQQMAAFVYRLFKPGKDIEGGSNSTKFVDLQDSTYFGYISWANGTGIIKGKNETTFDPMGGIILQDAYTMLIRALGHETEEYIYPFTYIDKAEELGLDKGLDSVVGYETKLTRGDVAVLLRNTFFADTSELSKVKYIVTVGDELYQYIEKETNLTLAEYKYEVNVGDFVVRATPKYAFNDSVDSDTYAPLYEEFSDDMLQLVAMDGDEPIAEFYYEFAATGLSGKADDYIMNEMEVFYTVAEENGQLKIDNVYFMTGSKQVLESNSATGYRVENAKDEDDYYAYHPDRKSSDENKYKKVEGYITVGNETIYFFDAPYSYIKPNYNSINYEAVKEQYGSTANEVIEALRYTLRNENNVKPINIKCLDIENGTYSYYLDNSKAAAVNSAEDLVNTLHRVYTGGAYTIKFFDINVDGIYDYMQYMPATYGFMDGKDGKYFSTSMKENAPLRIENKGSDNDVSFIPTIYYNGANITGESFNDGDFVVAHLNPEANAIHVISVVKPYNGYISAVRYSSGLVKVDNQWFQTAYAHRIVENFTDGAAHAAFATLEGKQISFEEFYNHPGVFYLKHNLGYSQTFPGIIDTEGAAKGEVFNIYAYKLPGAYNQILWYDHVEDATMSFEMDELAIPVSNEKNAGETYAEFEFDRGLGEKLYYARLYYNGKIEYLPLNTDEMYPGLGEGYMEGRYNLSLIEGQTPGRDLSDLDRAYVDKICKVKIGTDGHITLVPVLHALDEDGVYSGVSRDSTMLQEKDNRQLYGNDLLYEYEGVIKKVAGTRYALVDKYQDDFSLLGDVRGDSGDTKVKFFDMNSTTRIIIKNIIEKKVDPATNDEVIEEFEYLEFNASNFNGSTSVDTPLTNIQYVLRCNPDSTSRANLVLLYAEAENFEFETKVADNSWRIVSDVFTGRDEEGLFRNYYRLFNPHTGEVDEEVPGDRYEDKATALKKAVDLGIVTKVKSNNQVDEDSNKLVGKLSKTGLVYITEYDETFNYFGVVPVEAVENAVTDGDVCCGETLKDFAEGYIYTPDDYNNIKNFNYDKKGNPASFETVVDKNGKSIAKTDGARLFYEITDETVFTVITSVKSIFENDYKDLRNAEFKLADISAIQGNNKEFKCYNSKVLNKKGSYTTEYAEYVKAYVYADAVRYEDVIPTASLVVIVVNGSEEDIYTDYDDNFTVESHDEH